MSAREAWTLFWQSGEVDACVPRDAGLRAGLEKVWTDWFAGLPDEARLLDIGCGNGALTLRAVQAADRVDHRLQIDAVDAAAIDPKLPCRSGGRDERVRVRFRGGVVMEQLPFAASCFDAVCSQFAFEYAEPEAAAAELARVLKPGGMLRMLVHAADTAVTGEVRAQHQALAGIASSDLFARADDLLHALIAARRAGQGASPAIQAAIRAFRDALEVQRSGLDATRLEGAAGRLLTAVAALPSQALAEPECDPGDWASALMQRLEAQLTRFSDMLHASRDEAGLAELLAMVRAAGFADATLTRAEIVPPGVCIGRWLEAHRDA
ncbi:MAG: class I SAM-dependent methyltransferase [Wenzhouxiangellaceae bacterium]|nr:class I SAM-dependent methyltransferase [Wenzhouxiangellaceae bacterium]